MAALRSDFDTSWKETLHDFFPDAMAFFFPDIHADIDWRRGYDFLELELRQAVRRAARGKKVADVLAQVWMQSGEEQWVLIHVEVQSQVKPDFEQATHLTHTLLYARHKCPVASLAILGDTRPDWRPSCFGYSVWGCEVEMRFPVVKLLDYATRWDELEASPNVFAVVVMAHLKAQETHDDALARKAWKMRLIRVLYKRGYDQERIRKLFRAMELMMVLPGKVEEEFTRELIRFEEEEAMPVLTQFERRAIAKGRREGRQEGQAVMLERFLERKFGSLDTTTRERLAAADAATLVRWFDRAITAERLEDVFA